MIFKPILSASESDSHKQHSSSVLSALLGNHNISCLSAPQKPVSQKGRQSLITSYLHRRGGSQSVDCRFGWKILEDCIFFWLKSCRCVLCRLHFWLLSKNCRFQPNFNFILQIVDFGADCGLQNKFKIGPPLPPPLHKPKLLHLLLGGAKGPGK